MTCSNDRTARIGNRERMNLCTLFFKSIADINLRALLNIILNITDGLTFCFLSLQVPESFMKSKDVTPVSYVIFLKYYRLNET